MLMAPEVSSRGNDAKKFYDTLLSKTYMYYDGSRIYFLGDYNGRKGSKVTSIALWNPFLTVKNTSNQLFFYYHCRSLWY